MKTNLTKERFMQLPSARPNEQVVQEFTIANNYTLAQIILALLIPGIFYGLYLGAQQIGLLVVFPAAIIQGLFTLISLVLSLYLILGALYLRLARHYFVTNERIIQVIGWLAQSSISVEYASITDMTVNQDVFERFLINSGTLNIDTAGSPGEEIMLHHVARPYQLRDEIFNYSEQEEKKKTTTNTATAVATPITASANQPNPPTTPIP